MGEYVKVNYYSAVPAEIKYAIVLNIMKNIIGTEIM